VNTGIIQFDFTSKKTRFLKTVDIETVQKSDELNLPHA
jgi:hypothetical protein